MAGVVQMYRREHGFTIEQWGTYVGFSLGSLLNTRPSNSDENLIPSHIVSVIMGPCSEIHDENESFSLSFVFLSIIFHFFLRPRASSFLLPTYVSW